MCGIFGIVINKESKIDRKSYQSSLKHLFTLSESRGREASGFAARFSDKILVNKTPFPSRQLIKSEIFKSAIENLFQEQNESYLTIGHSRLVTNGYEHENINNQPVIKNKIVGVHNGIVVNVKQLWGKYSDEEKKSELDSEIILTLIRRFYSRNSQLHEAICKVFSEINGMTSIAVIFQDLNNLLLATNNGSLYFMKGEDGNSVVFASEFYILKSLIERAHLNDQFGIKQIKQLKPNFSILLDLTTLKFSLKKNEISIDNTEYETININKHHLSIEEVLEKNQFKNIYINKSLEHHKFDPPEIFVKEANENDKKIQSLKRCSKCLLPETLPFIIFDDKGICNYCKNYIKQNYKGSSKLKDFVKNYRKDNGKPDCLIPFSGGRDSSFTLHYVKNELNLSPIAYSYDWGMITDLARRNQSRMCGKLGIEHILISADIRKKRANIRKNVLAWLKRPNLGTIPLFMAGDKQYFHFANVLMHQNNLKLSILGENMLETTNFKFGFCGIKPKFDSKHTYTLSIFDKLKMMFFYGIEYLLNLSFINSSLFDTIDAFKSYYLIKHKNINLYDYILWDEKKIKNLLISEYDWETDPGTETTWRIGDGTAAFYNYIYYTISGFTENDTFRSNQIREGMLTRENALKAVNEENRPRWDSLKWYCDTIDIDFESTIKIINSIKKIF